MKPVFIVLCFSFNSILAYSQWTWQNPLPQGNNLNCIKVIDANTCYSVGNCGTIIKTTNGGTDWSILNSGTSADLFSVFFSTPNTGYAVGSGGTAIKTINGGTD
jgi:photosystem II stability/assembly factor-like uncharacterized protein